MAPVARRCLPALRAAQERRLAGREEMFVVYRRAKARVARLLGVEPAAVAFLAHASEG